MALSLTSHLDVISKEAFQALRELVTDKANETKVPTDSPFVAPKGIPLAQLDHLKMVVTRGYIDMDWANEDMLMAEMMQREWKPSALWKVRMAIIQCLGRAPGDNQEAFTELAPFFKQYPAFGDLYCALACMKFTEGSLDAAAELLRIAELCPSLHVSLHKSLKNSIEALRPRCTSLARGGRLKTASCTRPSFLAFPRSTPPLLTFLTDSLLFSLPQTLLKFLIHCDGSLRYRKNSLFLFS